jgi:hypothetical protein
MMYDPMKPVPPVIKTTPPIGLEELRFEGSLFISSFII